MRTFTKDQVVLDSWHFTRTNYRITPIKHMNVWWMNNGLWHNPLPKWHCTSWIGRTSRFIVHLTCLEIWGTVNISFALFGVKLSRRIRTPVSFTFTTIEDSVEYSMKWPPWRWDGQRLPQHNGVKEGLSAYELLYIFLNMNSSLLTETRWSFST